MGFDQDFVKPAVCSLRRNGLSCGNIWCSNLISYRALSYI